MIRNRFDDSDTKVSLFPFLDALSGVIGILALIICTIAALNLKSAKQVIEHPHDAQAKQPVYFECREKTVVVHPSREVIPIQQGNEVSNDLRNRFNRIQASSDQYVLLLVRPEGVDTFHLALQMARQIGVRIGYDAVYTDGEIQIQTPVHSQ